MPYDLGGIVGSSAIGITNNYYSTSYLLICWGMTPGSVRTVRNKNMLTII